MFDIGFLELAVIGVIALIVLGPEKLPGFARQAGRMVGRMQRMAGELKAEFEREADFQELKKLKEEFDASELRSSASELRRTASDVKHSLNGRVDLGTVTRRGAGGETDSPTSVPGADGDVPQTKPAQSPADDDEH